MADIREKRWEDFGSERVMKFRAKKEVEPKMFTISVAS